MLTCAICPSTDNVKDVHLRGGGVNKFYFDSTTLCKDCRKFLRGRFMLGKNAVISGYKTDGLGAPIFLEAKRAAAERIAGTTPAA